MLASGLDLGVKKGLRVEELWVIRFAETTGTPAEEVGVSCETATGALG